MSCDYDGKRIPSSTNHSHRSDLELKGHASLVSKPSLQDSSASFIHSQNHLKTLSQKLCDMESSLHQRRGLVYDSSLSSNPCYSESCNRTAGIAPTLKHPGSQRNRYGTPSHNRATSLSIQHREMPGQNLTVIRNRDNEPLFSSDANAISKPTSVVSSPRKSSFTGSYPKPLTSESYSHRSPHYFSMNPESRDGARLSSAKDILSDGGKQLDSWNVVTEPTDMPSSSFAPDSVAASASLNSLRTPSEPIQQARQDKVGTPMASPHDHDYLIRPPPVEVRTPHVSSSQRLIEAADGLQRSTSRVLETLKTRLDDNPNGEASSPSLSNCSEVNPYVNNEPEYNFESRTLVTDEFAENVENRIKSLEKTSDMLLQRLMPLVDLLPRIGSIQNDLKDLQGCFHDLTEIVSSAIGRIKALEQEVGGRISTRNEVKRQNTVLASLQSSMSELVENQRNVVPQLCDQILSLKGRLGDEQRERRQFQDYVSSILKSRMN